MGTGRNRGNFQRGNFRALVQCAPLSLINNSSYITQRKQCMPSWQKPHKLCHVGLHWPPLPCFTLFFSSFCLCLSSSSTRRLSAFSRCSSSFLLRSSSCCSRTCRARSSFSSHWDFLAATWERGRACELPKAAQHLDLHDLFLQEQNSNPHHSQIFDTFPNPSACSFIRHLIKCTVFGYQWQCITLWSILPY